MDNLTFDKLSKKTMCDCLNLLNSKRKQYGKEDRLHNFKVAARINNTTPLLAVWGMYTKHLVSVMDLIHEDNPDVDIDEKINDSINYHSIIKALLYERRNASNRKVP